jgi:L-threonylcarbamoyladenylate synthase
LTPQEALVSGKVIAIPTDTVYGLACLPEKPSAVERIFELKRRQRDLALPVVCADLRQAAEFGRLPSWAGNAWPGPTTLVVRRKAPAMSWNLGEQPDSVGLRVPAHVIVQGLAAELGPLVATSANRHGEATPETAEGVLDVFGDEIELVVDGGRITGLPSTIVDCRGVTPRLLRQGTVRLSQLTG